MERFVILDGLVAPLDRSNVDTDAIIPKQYMKSIKRSGFGVNLFDEWRYLDVGSLGQDCTGRRQNPTFVLNQARFEGASILLTRQNFGCGSSREHAAWALKDYGSRVILAESFGEIFFSNCCKNGMLPIALEPETIDALMQEVLRAPGYRVVVDLVKQLIIKPDWERLHFVVDPFRQECLLNGWDDIELTLRHADEIRAYEAARRLEQPWLFG